MDDPKLACAGCPTTPQCMQHAIMDYRNGTQIRAQQFQ